MKGKWNFPHWWAIVHCSCDSFICSYSFRFLRLYFHTFISNHFLLSFRCGNVEVLSFFLITFRFLIKFPPQFFKKNLSNLNISEIECCEQIKKQLMAIDETIFFNEIKRCPYLSRPKFSWIFRIQRLKQYFIAFILIGYDCKKWCNWAMTSCHYYEYVKKTHQELQSANLTQLKLIW